MISYGSGFDPELWQPPFGEPKCIRAAGFYNAQRGEIEPLSHQNIVEHVTHSWFRDAGRPLHPWEGETVPRYEPGGERYSWAKAPRYAGQVVETGCFAELFVAGDPLIRSIYKAEGVNVWGRQFSRLHRPTLTLPAMRRSLLELDKHFDDGYYQQPKDAADGEGYGLVQAARGSLGHWVQFKGGKITRYQIVTPTAWNASPRDAEHRRGHWEQSLIGTPVADDNDPVELGHVIRSHDACLVCTVHFLPTGRSVRYNV